MPFLLGEINRSRGPATADTAEGDLAAQYLVCRLTVQQSVAVRILGHRRERSQHRAGVEFDPGGGIGEG